MAKPRRVNVMLSEFTISKLHSVRDIWSKSGPSKMDYISEMTIFPKCHTRETFSKDHITEIKPKRPYIRRPYNRNRMSFFKIFTTQCFEKSPIPGEESPNLGHARLYDGPFSFEKRAQLRHVMDLNHATYFKMG